MPRVETIQPVHNKQFIRIAYSITTGLARATGRPYGATWRMYFHRNKVGTSVLRFCATLGRPIDRRRFTFSLPDPECLGLRIVPQQQADTGSMVTHLPLLGTGHGQTIASIVRSSIRRACMFHCWCSCLRLCLRICLPGARGLPC